MHDIIGFRIIVSPARNLPGEHPSLTAESGVRHIPLADGINSVVENEEHDSHGIRSRGKDHMEGNGGLDTNGRGKGSKHTRSMFTVKTFPPPYRDADSRLLHDVYEVLVGLFEEVPGRFKVSQDELRVLSIELQTSLMLLR